VNSTTTANIAAPSDAATTTITTRAAGPVSAAKDALGGRTPPDDQGVFHGKGGLPDHLGRLGVARPRVSCLLLMLFFVPFNFWVLTSLVHTKALFPDMSSASAGESPAGGSGPQPAPSFLAGKSATTPARPLSPPAPVGSGPGGSEPEAAPREAEDAPQEEAARPDVTTEEPAAPAAPDAMAKAPPAEMAAEEVAATAEAAAPEVVEVPSSDPQSVQEDKPEVVYGRHLLPKPVKVPLSRLMVKGQRVMEEIEEGLRQEWEELEAEHHRLSD
jgi:hypothetical protein